MAITILNELALTYKSVQSTLISPFMKPVVYFSVSGASAVTTPTAEIEIKGSNETLTFDCIFEKTSDDVHYFYCDLSDILKYILRYFDGTEYPDDLEFINGNILQKFDEYLRSIDIDIYFERDSTVSPACAQSTTQTIYIAYLANEMPSYIGFNLANFNILENLTDLKWCRDTYNAIFFIGYGATEITVNGEIVYSDTVGGYGIYQWKFGKDNSELVNGHNTVTIKNAYMDTPKTIHIDYSYTTGCNTCLAWQHPKLGYVSYPFDGANEKVINATSLAELKKSFTSLINTNTLKEVIGFDTECRRILHARVPEKYWKLFEYLHSARHAYLYVGDQLAEWVGGEAEEDTLENIFDQLYIQNTELDNKIVGTAFLVTEHDTGAKTITLDHALPSMITVPANPDYYWAMYVGPGNACNISAISSDRLTITYTLLRNTISVGNKVYFMNPFLNGRMLDYDYLLGPAGTWGAKYITPGGIIEKSDGTFTLVCNGVSAAGVGTIGLAHSVDLYNWTYDPASPLFEGNVSPFNKTWCSSSGIQSSCNPVKIPGSPYYYWMVTGKNASNLWDMGMAIIDEDFNVISVYDDPFVITGHANNYGNAGGSFIYYNGQYYAAIVNRTQAVADDWIAYIMNVDMTDLSVSNVSQLITSTGLNNWNGRNVDVTTLFVYNDRLYCIVGGTGEATAGPLYGNRSYALLKLTSTGWVQIVNNPILTNPIEGVYLWPSVQSWCIDHAGGYYSPIIKDNKLYVYLSMNNGTDSYRITGMVYDLPYLDDNKTTWVECKVAGSYSTKSNDNGREFDVTLELPEQFNIKM